MAAFIHLSYDDNGIILSLQTYNDPKNSHLRNFLWKCLFFLI